MANVCSGFVWSADTVGILSKEPVTIKAIGVVPSSAGGTITLKYWDMSSYNTGSYIAFNATASSGTVTDTDTDHDAMTSTAFPAGDVVQVIKTGGAAANKTYHLIGTAGNNDRFIITPTSTWADEATKDYVVKVWPAKVGFVGLTQATTAKDGWYPFPGGLWLPNLILSTATSATVYLYMA